MPNFKGNNGIVLQPSEENVAYRFSFPACSSPSTNDGYLPAYTTISGAAVAAVKNDGTDATSDMIDSVLNTAYAVNVTFDYPTTTMAGTTGTGYYKLTFVLTLDNGTILEADFDRVRANDL